jgi:protein tyrosine phosphatase (PTP) superfamily phosphohydrolase (DUF442 family)
MSGQADIYNWLRIDDYITTSGMLNDSNIQHLADIGVGHIVDLSMSDDLAEKVASVIAKGMDYIHILVQYDNPTEENFEEFCGVLETLKGEKIHLHDRFNFRASAFLYRYHRDVLGWDEPKARELLEIIWDPYPSWYKFLGWES